jgi:hypothetical protein
MEGNEASSMWLVYLMTAIASIVLFAPFVYWMYRHSQRGHRANSTQFNEFERRPQFAAERGYHYHDQDPAYAFRFTGALASGQEFALSYRVRQTRNSDGRTSNWHELNLESPWPSQRHAPAERLLEIRRRQGKLLDWLSDSVLIWFNSEERKIMRKLRPIRLPSTEFNRQYLAFWRRGQSLPTFDQATLMKFVRWPEHCSLLAQLGPTGLKLHSDLDLPTCDHLAHLIELAELLWTNSANLREAP